MWLIGLATKKEKKELEKAGYEVKVVDINAFDKLIDPTCEPAKIDKSKDVFISVWVDCNIYDDLRETIESEKADLEYKRLEELRDLREIEAQKCFEEYDLGDIICEQADGWEQDGENIFLKKFYYTEKNPKDFDKDSEPATFIVKFKKNTDKIIDSHVNIW